MLIAAILFLGGCMHYVVREIPAQAGRETTEKKVALVGFSPFHSRVSSVRGNIIVYEAEIDGASTMKNRLGFGRPVAELVKPSLNSAVSREKIDAFMTGYLNEVKRSGAEELVPMFQVQGKDVLLKDIDADLIVVGIHLPGFQEVTTRGWAAAFATMLPFIATAGTVPYVFQFDAYSKFLVYDRNLNLLKRYETRNPHWVYVSWWATPNFRARDGILAASSANSSPISEAYHEDLETFEKMFRADFLSANQAAGQGQ